MTGLIRPASIRMLPGQEEALELVVDERVQGHVVGLVLLAEEIEKAVALGEGVDARQHFEHEAVVLTGLVGRMPEAMPDEHVPAG